MRIDSALPMHITRAYGVGPTAPAAKPRASSLVAARVDKPVDFKAAPVQSPSNVLQLYNRAADRVEAAVAIQVGRELDVTG